MSRFDLPDFMVAFQVTGWGRPPTPARLPVPRPEPGQTLVEIEFASVTHLDLTVASGEFGIRPALPYIGGVEGAGVVVSSDRLPAGSPVSVRGGDLGIGSPGCWAQYVCVPDGCAPPVPPGMPADLAALYFDPATAAWEAVHEVARIGSGDSVLIGGAAGAVGSLTAQLALRARAARVFGEVSSAQRAHSLPAGVQPMLPGKRPAEPVDVLIDTVGGSRLRHSLGSVRAGGRAVLVGYTDGPDLPLEIPRWLLADVALLPVNMLRRADSAERNAPRLAALLTGGELSLARSVVGRPELPAVFTSMARGGLTTRTAVRMR